MKNATNTKVKAAAKKVIFKRTDQLPLPEAELKAPLKLGVLKHHGLKFKKAGHLFVISEGFRNKRRPYVEPVIAPIENIEQTFYPLGVYKYDIVSNMDIYIHVSLLEIVKFWSDSSASDSLNNARWIRVGYTVEAPSEALLADQDHNQEEDPAPADLVPLVFLPNQIARAILSVDSSYVDLAAISPTEYYMVS